MGRHEIPRTLLVLPVLLATAGCGPAGPGLPPGLGPGPGIWGLLLLVLVGAVAWYGGKRTRQSTPAETADHPQAAQALERIDRRLSQMERRLQKLEERSAAAGDVPAGPSSSQGETT